MEEAVNPLFPKRAVRSRRVAVQATHRRRFSALKRDIEATPGVQMEVERKRYRM
jgi:hypothetical protein